MVFVIFFEKKKKIEEDRCRCIIMEKSKEHKSNYNTNHDGSLLLNPKNDTIQHTYPTIVSYMYMRQAKMDFCDFCDFL